MDVVWVCELLDLQEINLNIMANQLWQVIAKRDSFGILKGMNVEILIRNASRKPNQKEVIEAINTKYGDKTASNGTSLTIFEINQIK